MAYPNENNKINSLIHFYTNQRKSVTHSVKIPLRRENKEQFSFRPLLRAINFASPDVKEFKYDGKHMDYSFPPNRKSVYGDKKDQEYDIEWVRAESFCKDGSLYDKIDPKDISQGYIGNCWFVAALKCLAEKPDLIRKIFPLNATPEDGKYKLKLFKNGLPAEVEVDSLVPMNRDSGKTMGCYSRSNQLWVPLVEKAYAKLHGSYFSLVGGECHEALMDLTGYPGGLLPNKLSGSPQFFDFISSSKGSGMLMTAGIDCEKPGHGQDAMRVQGLIANHAYSVSDAKVVHTQGGAPVRMVELRNPWSSLKWRGHYSEQDPGLTKGMRKELHLCTDNNSGEFWMPFDDFQKRFDVFSYCQCADNMKFASTPFTFKRDEKTTEGFSSPSFDVTVPEGHRLSHVTVHQKCKRYMDSKPYIDICAFVLGKNTDKETANGDANQLTNEMKCHAFTSNELDRSVCEKVDLPAGKYRVLPYTSGAIFMDGEKSREAALRFYFMPEEGVEGGEDGITIVKRSRKLLSGADGHAILLNSLADKQSFPNFTLMLKVMGGLFVYGVDNKGTENKNLGGGGSFDVKINDCQNMVPSLESWLQNDEQKFEMKGNERRMAVVGAFVRRSNDRCGFEMSVTCD